jgi:hypothetical protein
LLLAKLGAASALWRSRLQQNDRDDAFAHGSEPGGACSSARLASMQFFF